MLIQARNLKGFKLGASDGEIGKVKQFYFDDISWTVRYLVADTGDWLRDRSVLISPYALDAADQDTKIIPVHLTRKQIEESPALDTHRPVSRQYEMSYNSYYDWPAYWDGPNPWGTAIYPKRGNQGWTPLPARQTGQDDRNLRSTEEVGNYSIQAQDGEIGHVFDFVIDDETWRVRYLIAKTTNWWPGKKVLISTTWIDKVSWANAEIKLHLTRESIKASPEFSETLLINRDYEAHLHRHYDRIGYWTENLTTAKSA